MKKVGSKTSYYLVSLDSDPQDDRGSEMVLGKVRGNSVGDYIFSNSTSRCSVATASSDAPEGYPQACQTTVPLPSPH